VEVAWTDWIWLFIAALQEINQAKNELRDQGVAVD
jgi:hypothetical protein